MNNVDAGAAQAIRAHCFQKMQADLSRFRMLAPGDDVLAAVSGGADSMCLLSLLWEHRAKLGIRVRAAHVNHGIRGAAADADESAVRQWCEARGIPLFCAHIDVPGLSRENRQSVELAAREARYAFFASLSPDKIATAHTGADACETMLMNLTRGAGLPGLCAIPPVRGNIIRPLISFTRKETEAYCGAVGISYATDETNLSDVYTRNRFRLRVLPVLSEIAPHAQASMLRCIDTLREENDYMAQAAAAELRSRLRNNGEALSLHGFAALHPALRKRVLAAYLAGLPGCDAETRHILLLDAHVQDPGFALQLPKNVRVKNCGGMLALAPLEAPARPSPVEVNKNEKHRIVFGSVILSIEKEIACSGNFSPGAVDFSKIDDIMYIRSRLSGDRIALPGRGCTKTLKKLFCELAIPPQRREEIPVLADSRGVIWVQGVGVSEERAPDGQTKEILMIQTE